MSMTDLLVRLSRRGRLTIVAEDGRYAVSFDAPGPYQGRAWCTLDEADLWSRCGLGASNWHGEGSDLAALLVECEQASRPQSFDVDALVGQIERRRESRTSGPPLPSYRRWDGWRPGSERWLTAPSHIVEYLGGYLRDLEVERAFEDEQREAAARREQRRVRSVLEG